MAPDPHVEMSRDLFLIANSTIDKSPMPQKMQPGNSSRLGLSRAILTATGPAGR